MGLMIYNEILFYVKFLLHPKCEVMSKVKVKYVLNKQLVLFNKPKHSVQSTVSS